MSVFTGPGSRSAGARRAPAQVRRPGQEQLERRVLFAAGSYYAIHLVDGATGRGVPQVDLVMTDGTRYTSDSGGTVAFNRAGYLNVSDTFVVEAYGYGLASGTSFTVTPTLGGNATVTLARSEIAQRLYRETGENLYSQTVAVGGTSPVTTTNANPNLSNASVYGQDSGLTAVYKGKLYEFWGDTGVDTNDDGNQDGANYHTTGGTINLPANGGGDPSAGENITYFTDSSGRAPKAMFPVGSFGYGNALIWASSPMVTYDSSGTEKMVIGYYVTGGGSAIEQGFGVWNDSTQQFDKVTSYPTTALIQPGQDATLTSFGGVNYYVIPNGNSFLRVRDDYADVTNINSYQVYTPLKPGTTFSTTNPFGGNTLAASDVNTDANGKVVWTWAANTMPLNGLEFNDLASRGLVPWSQNPFAFADADNPSNHVAFSTSAVAYNDGLKAWTFIGQQLFGNSLLGEIWYAQAPTLTGPWTYARKVQTDARANGANDTYTFYNLIQHPEYDENSTSLYYSGTYTSFLVTGGLQGQYFANSNLTGYVFKQSDGPIDFTYGSGSSNALVGNVNNFSVKWVGKVAFSAAGTYQFRVTTDAGARLVVNGATLVNQLAGTAQASYTGSITVGANATDNVELDYASLASTAAGIKLEWLVPGTTTWADVPSSALSHAEAQPIDNYNTVMYRLDLTDPRLNTMTPGTGLTAQYFNNNDLTGYVSTAPNQIVNATYPVGTSPAAGVDPTTYSVRYTGLIQPTTTGTYTFYLTSAGGARLWVNGHLLVDDYADHAARTDTATINLTAYQRANVRVEYQDGTAAGQAKLEWSAAAVARQVVPATALYATPNGLLATYFNDQNLTQPAVTETTPTVNVTQPPFNNDGTPDAASVAADGIWSARWTGQVRPDYTGAYTFTGTSDDGLRVWVNGVKLVDNWRNQGATAVTGTINLVAGQLYDVVVEYYNDLLAAVAQLAWSNPQQTGGASVIVPETNLFAAPVPIAAPLAIAGPVAYVRLDADSSRVDVWNNATATGAPAQQVPRDLVTSMSYAAAAGADALTVDFANGNPLVAGGLTFAGGGGVNTLTVVGTAGNDAVTVGASAVTVSAAFGTATLPYANLAAITVAGGAGADTFTQSAQPGGGATLAVSGPTAADALAVAAGTFTLPTPVAGGGPVGYPLGTLTIAAGASVVMPTAAALTDRTVLDVTHLTLNGTLDLGGNAMIVRNGDLSAVSAAIAAAWADGAWTGPGLTSSAAAADPGHLLGVGAIVNAGRLDPTFAGRPVAAADVLVRPTYYGDANLDGVVNAADYVRLDAGFLNGGATWGDGDFNGDRVVDGSDYTLADSDFSRQPGPLAGPAAVVVAAAPAPRATARGVPPAPAVVTDWWGDDRRRRHGSSGATA